MLLTQRITYRLASAILLCAIGSSAQTSTPQQIHVDIKSCNPPDTKASIGQEIIWDDPGKGHQYDINFVKPVMGSLKIPAGATGYHMKGSVLCNRATVYLLSSTPLCYFTYNITMDNGQPCKDPGVRVIPPSGGLQYVWFVVVVGLLGYGVFRIVLRNRASASR